MTDDPPRPADRPDAAAADRLDAAVIDRPEAAVVGWTDGAAADRLDAVAIDRGMAAPAADWRWVDEWRRGDEPTPWGPGLVLATFTALVIGTAVYVISQGLADRLFLAVMANVVVAAGLTPALWMSRGLPVLRWISLGGAAGTLVSWISLLFFRHF